MLIQFVLCGTVLGTVQNVKLKISCSILFRFCLPKKGLPKAFSTGRKRTNSTQGEGMENRRNDEEQGKCLPSGERVPRGRCAAPLPPAPDFQRAERMLERKSSLRRGRCESRIILVPEGRAKSRRPLSKWQAGYIDFKRKVWLLVCRWRGLWG